MTNLPPTSVSDPDLIGLKRRSMLRNVGMGAIAAAAAGAVLHAKPASAQAIDDAAILNFALNLEYLEAEYYIRAAYGYGLSAADTSGDGYAGSVIGGRQVTFATNAIQQYALEIANDELNHVRLLRAVLGAGAVGEPAIDLTNSFNTLAQAAGLGATFDPFADENSFLIGSFVFEDVGVTAYHGAAPLVQNKDILSAAAGILAVEAYHASEIRLLLAMRGLGSVTNAISAVRASLSQDTDDQGVLNSDGSFNIVPTDSNSLVYSRTARQVLNVVYGGVDATSGVFFPAGMNGVIR